MLVWIELGIGLRVWSCGICGAGLWILGGLMQGEGKEEKGGMGVCRWIWIDLFGRG